MKLLLILLFSGGSALFSQSISKDTYRKKILETALLNNYKFNPEKKEAAKFLLANIDVHYSQNYNWIDKNKVKFDFNEFHYPDIKLAEKAFQKLRDSISLTPKLYSIRDIDTISPELLIKNIDLAFDAWKNNSWSKSYSFETFCEYILPYRSLSEPLEDWRTDYSELISQSISGRTDKPVDAATQTILALKNFRFLSSRPDPIPYLSPKQLLFRREGACNDLANLTLLACRSMGIAVTFDFTPEYGASSKRHFWDTVIDENGKHIPFNGNCFGNPQGLPYAYNATEKRLAKVFRKTYAIQLGALASIQDSISIPEGFLREKNTLDVTDEYVSTGTIRYPSGKTDQHETGYLNVFNLAKWRVVDWGKKIKNTLEFNNVGLNIVYLPSFYDSKSKKMILAPYPVLLDLNKQQLILKPNYEKTFSYNLTRDLTKKDSGLDFNSFEVFENETYSLYVWDNGWKKTEEAQATREHIKFSKMPDNGLFLALCPKSNGYERVFRINSQTKQLEWF